MKWNHLAAAAAIAVVAMLSGCASVQKAGHDASDQAKTFSPLNGKAVVYVYRDELLGSAIKMPVEVDNVVAGQTGPKSFLQLAVLPGHHTITSHSEKDASLPIDVEAGKTYYVWQEVKMGIMVARSALHLVSADIGQLGVRKCDLLHTEAASLRMPEGVTIVVPSKPATPLPATEAPAATTQAMPAAAETVATTAAPEPMATTNAAPDAGEGSLAVLDDRVNKPMFASAQDVASRHQCERLLRVRSVNGADAHFYSACPGTSTPIEIACNGSQCEEAAPHG